VRVIETRLAGPLLLEHPVHGDDRGFFQESFRAEALAAHGVAVDWVQDNHSRSRRGVLRGMHWAVEPGQCKLVRCARGRIWDVVVDIRRGSPTFGRWEGYELDDVSGRSLLVPLGFAHGFLVLSDLADVLYKCSAYYEGAKERGFAWDDPEVGIAWPQVDGEVEVSARDAGAPRLAEVAEQIPFTWSG
jgi:dTDP-4-dehydrorhamnose 3,5-epimerase